MTAISIGMAGVAGPATAEATAEATAHQLSLLSSQLEQHVLNSTAEAMAHQLSLLSNQLEQHGVVLAKPAPADAPRQGRWALLAPSPWRV